MRRGEIAGLMVATPCTCFSILSHRLRSTDDPWGLLWHLDGLADRDAKKLLDGNRLMQHTLLILRAALRLAITWIFEHPVASRAFATDERRHILEQPHILECKF